MRMLLGFCIGCKAVVEAEGFITHEIAMNDARRVYVFETALNGALTDSHLTTPCPRTRIWYRKYWMNCFSSGLEVSSRCKSVPRSSVTKYLASMRLLIRVMTTWARATHKSSSGEMNTSSRLMI